MKDTTTSIGAPELATQARLIEMFEQDLGYEFLGNKTDEDNSNIIPELLRANLLNRKDKEGKPLYSKRLADAAIVKLQSEAKDLSSGLYAANKAVYSILKYGAKVQDEKGAIKTVMLIDWDIVTNNDFQIAEEVTVAGLYDKRPDLVIYVNGIALGLIELKRASVSVVKGIAQNIANHTKEMFIMPFFTTMQLLTAGNNSEGLRYGTIGTPAKKYLEWRHDGFGQNLEERDPVDVLIESEAAEFEEKLDSQVYEMFSPSRMLGLIRNFTIFDRGKKKVARYSQYYGIKRTLARTAKHEGGIVWHSQGSGKSIEMVLLAKHVIERDHDGRVLIVTDREELDEQIEKLFIGVDEKIRRTKSGKDLIDAINDTAGGNLICSLIHKFGKHSGKTDESEDKLDEEAVAKYIEELKAALPTGFKVKGNFTIFVDECHRTQSGLLHQAMKAILPDAILVGYTGTPLLKKDKKTSMEVFGPYIHTYKFPEAVRDGVILDLRYEARDIPQDVTAKKEIDAWFEAKTAGLTDRAKARLKEKWATMQNVVSSKSRLGKIVEDIILDFATKPRLMNGAGNAMLVADDILTACKFYNLFHEHEFKGCAVISSYVPAPSDISTSVVDPEHRTDEEVKYDTYCKMIGVKRGEEVKSIAKKVEDFEKEAKRQFVDEPANMKLLIVVDKLLTGFDAPPCTYLYLDKHMQDHGLFQAICRVNRLDDETKDFGYIVDYRKLFGDLQDSLAMYSSDKAFAGYDAEDVDGFVKNVVKEASERFKTILAVLDALCDGVESPAQGPQYRAYFGCQGADTPEEETQFGQRREKLYRLVGALVRAYAVFAPRMESAKVPQADRDFYAARVKFYLELRNDIGQASGDFLDLKPYEPDMRYLIDTYIAAGESERLTTLENFSLLDFIDDKSNGNESEPMSKEAQDNVAETIENNAAKELVHKRLMNPAFFERMSVVLKKLIEDRKAGVIEYKKLLEEYKKLAEEIKNPSVSGRYPASIAGSPVKEALYDNFGEDEKLTLALHKAFLGSKLQGFKYNIAKQNQIKSALFAVLKDDDKVEAVYKILEAQEA
jgi:type I restriction enzyme R subunit